MRFYGTAQRKRAIERDELAEDAAALLRAGRALFRPGEGDRSRVLCLLEVLLTAMPEPAGASVAVGGCPANEVSPSRVDFVGYWGHFGKSR